MTILLALALLGAPAAGAEPPVLQPGDEAPLFSGVLHNPEAAGTPRVDLGAMVGSDAEEGARAKAVLVSFFATWCKPCAKELPLLQQLSTDYRARGLRVVSVAIDKDEESWPKIAAMAKAYKVTYPIVKDRYNLIARQYLGARTALPSLFILDQAGKIALVRQGYTDDAATFLRAAVEKALP